MVEFISGLVVGFILTFAVIAVWAYRSEHKRNKLDFAGSELGSHKSWMDDESLTKSDEKVLDVLTRTEGKSITMKKVAAEAKLSVRTVEKSIAKLKSLGIVSVAVKSSKGNTYEVLGA